MTGTTIGQIQTRTIGVGEESMRAFIYLYHVIPHKEAAFPYPWFKENSHNDDYFWIPKPK